MQVVRKILCMFGFHKVNETIWSYYMSKENLHRKNKCLNCKKEITEK